MECGKSCAKLMLMIFNTIFLITGIVLLAVTLWIRLDPDVWELLDVLQVDDEDHFVEWGAYILIAVGALILVAAVIGCCGACGESRCLLGTYCVLLCVVMVVEIIAAILVLVYRERAKSDVIDTLAEDFETKYAYQNDEFSNYARGINIAQYTLECCGIEGQSDYSPGVLARVDANAPFCNSTNGKRLPATCFKRKVNDKLPDDLRCGQVKTDEPPFMDGCRQDLLDFFESYALIFIGLSLAFAALEIFGLVFAICLCRCTGKY